MYPHIQTPNAITVVINDKPYSVTKSHKNYTKIVTIARGLYKASTEQLIELIKPETLFERVLGSNNTGFFLQNGAITCKINDEHFPLPDSLSKEILDVYKSQGNLEPLMKFVKKLSLNPRKEVVDELWGFISSCGLALTESGNFLAYKNVSNTFKDIYTGTMDNSPGTFLQMPRWKVEHDPNRTCAAGLHFAAWGYLQYYAYGQKTVILSISPADVVSIPTDYNNMKGRASAYKVLREVEQPEELKERTVYNDSGYYDHDDLEWDDTEWDNLEDEEWDINDDFDEFGPNY